MFNIGFLSSLLAFSIRTLSLVHMRVGTENSSPCSSILSILFHIESFFMLFDLIEQNSHMRLDSMEAQHLDLVDFDSILVIFL